MAEHQFQTEVSRLLHLIIHSLYSHKEIFLRELVSNASDALDKLKYLTVADEAYKGIHFEPRIDISFDKDAKTLSIADSGIGMNEADLVEHLGTIARSGTRLFLEKLSGDAKKDSNLIGQFGVGFYSAFMAADKIEVLTRKAGEDAAWLWVSDGKSGYSIERAEKPSHGTIITLHLNEEGIEFADRWRIQDLVKRYSQHIAFPIYLKYEKEEWDSAAKKMVKKGTTEDRINEASALWKRPKAELKEEDYVEFYKTISHDFDEPLHYVHTHAEGTLEYTTLFYIPKKAPIDMYQVDYKPGVKLYVKRVFITDDEKELLPTWMRFVRGVIDSEDLPLNVSREILQQNKVLVNIRNASVKKILSELKDLSTGNKEKYDQFIAEFNRPLKEGIYSDFANKEALLELVRYKSSSVDGWTSLAEYKSRMPSDQKAIYYLAGAKGDRLRKSPLLEAFKRKGIEVLLMDDDIDELVAPMIGRYGDFELKAIDKADVDLGGDEKADESKAKDYKGAFEKAKEALKDQVKDVRVSRRLTDSPSCIVVDGADPGFQMRRLMEAIGREELPEFKPILELNPEHALVGRLKAAADANDAEALEDYAKVLLGQAYLAEGAPLEDPLDFVARMNRLLTK